MIDYRLLLLKYMEHVLDCEGTDFLEHIGTCHSDVDFTEAEEKLLYKLSEQILEDR